MKKHASTALTTSAAVFALVVVLTLGWVRDIRLDSVRRQKQTLELALNRSLMLCYCLEGAYPATLEELLEKYPLGFDRDSFTVDYRLQGSNMFPEITILETGR